MAKCGDGVLVLQLGQGQPDAPRRRNVPEPTPLSSNIVPVTRYWPRVSAKLSARKLARLSLLGYRTRPELKAFLREGDFRLAQEKAGNATKKDN